MVYLVSFIWFGLLVYEARGIETLDRSSSCVDFS